MGRGSKTTDRPHGSDPSVHPCVPQGVGFSHQHRTPLNLGQKIRVPRGFLLRCTGDTLGVGWGHFPDKSTVLLQKVILGIEKLEAGTCAEVITATSHTATPFSRMGTQKCTLMASFHEPKLFTCGKWRPDVSMIPRTPPFISYL